MVFPASYPCQELNPKQFAPKEENGKAAQFFKATEITAVLLRWCRFLLRSSQEASCNTCVWAMSGTDSPQLSCCHLPATAWRSSSPVSMACCRGLLALRRQAPNRPSHRGSSVRLWSLWSRLAECGCSPSQLAMLLVQCDQASDM